ncbi:MAG: cytochrome c3 family protein [Nitrospiria bacterium]
MNNRGLRVVIVLLVLIGLSVGIKDIGASPLEAVYQTRHNLSVSTAENADSCTVCHTDRRPVKTEDAAKDGVAQKTVKVVRRPPLWDRGRSAISPYRTLQTLPLDEHPYNHPTGPSLVCLSCHDGALGTDMHGINVDNPRVGAAADVPFDGLSGPRGAPPLSRVDHPISIRYPRRPDGQFVPLNPTVTRSRYWALPDRQAHQLILPTSDTSSYLDMPQGNLSGFDQLPNLVRTTDGMMECDSCHNPHSEAVRPFLRVPSATLCLVCHDR